jgi:hypothetical protein
MIRVTKSEQEDRTIITIDGQLAGENLEVVKLFCNQTIAEGKPLDIILRDVLTIDEAGRVLLSCLAAKGIRLLARDTLHNSGTISRLRPMLIYLRERPLLNTTTVIESLESQVQIWCKERVLHFA